MVIQGFKAAKLTLKRERERKRKGELEREEGERKRKGARPVNYRGFKRERERK